MRRVGRSVAVVLALGLLFGGAACSKPDSDAPVVVLDGSPRMPDDEGVATSLSTEEITLDGERTYPVSRALVSFSTYTGAVEPMLTREGQYVQIGLREQNGRQEMVWMAGIASVIDLDPPAVYYTGVLLRRSGDDLIFRDGTVIEAAEDVELPELPARVTVRIAPQDHVAVDVRSR